MSCKGCDVVMPIGQTGATGATGSTGAAGSNGANGTNGTSNLYRYGTDQNPTSTGGAVFNSSSYTYLLPLNTLNSIGDALIIRCKGIVNLAAVTTTLATLTLQFGGITIASQQAGPIAIGNANVFDIEVRVEFLTATSVRVINNILYAQSMLAYAAILTVGGMRATSISPNITGFTNVITNNTTINLFGTVNNSASYLTVKEMTIDLIRN